MDHDYGRSRPWRLHEAGNPAARDELILGHLPLARQLASRYRSRNEPLEDLVQVAMVGLIGAVDRFDPERATSFASFAIPTILGDLPLPKKARKWVSLAASAVALVGAFALRAAITGAGRPSAADPEAARRASRAKEEGGIA